MTLRAVCVLRVRTADRHHARASGCDVRMVHGCQLNAGFIVDFTLTDIRTVQYVIIIIKSHQPILLLPYLIFLKIVTALALIPFHFLADIASIIFHDILLCKISVALSVCAI